LRLFNHSAGLHEAGKGRSDILIGNVHLLLERIELRITE